MRHEININSHSYRSVQLLSSTLNQGPVPFRACAQLERVHWRPKFLHWHTQSCRKLTKQHSKSSHASRCLCSRAKNTKKQWARPKNGHFCPLCWPNQRQTGLISPLGRRTKRSNLALVGATCLHLFVTGLLVPADCVGGRIYALCRVITFWATKTHHLCRYRTRTSWSATRRSRCHCACAQLAAPQINSARRVRQQQNTGHVDYCCWRRCC